MIRVTVKVAIIAGLWYGAALYSVAFGQAKNKADAGVEPPQVEDEIVVRGRTPAELALQMQIAEDAVFGRFNEIDSNDEFDIHCRQEAVTGSRVPHRVCQPNFFRKAQTEAGEETVRKLQGGYAFDPAQFLAEAQYKRLLLAQEMKRLAIQDKELQNDLVRVASLKQALDATRKALAKTASAQKAAGEEALPYDAAIEADVRIGRKPWKHALSQRTFTFAHVFGKIGTVDVRCRGHAERLPYKLGVEWTLPEAWMPCDLHVKAPPGTTFSLYEFK